MNEHPTPSRADSLPIEEAAIAAEIIVGENPTLETVEIERLSRRNQVLLATIVRIQRELTETKNLLEQRTRRLRDYEFLLARQTDELNRERRQSHRSLAEVESYRERERQHKRTLLSLADELATTREQLARSERELATLKDECEERTLRSVAAEKEIIALRNRLQRQRGRLEGNSRTAGASKTRFEEDIEALLARSASNTRFEEDIEALLAKFERVETLGDPVRKTLDWPSPVISAHVPRYPCARVDLPDFLKGDRPRAAENMEGTR